MEHGLVMRGGGARSGGGGGPGCPRCGYDLTGVVESWAGECPLTGVCSECGLNLEWRRIFAGEGLAPLWSFEHGPHVSAWRFGVTWLRSIWPWLLWKRLRIECPVVKRRLALFVPVVLVVLHVLAIAVAIVLDPETWQVGMYASKVEWVARHVDVLVVPYIYGMGEIPVGIPLGGMMLAMGLMPLSMLLLAQTFNRARLRRVHLLRGYIYSLVSFTAWWLLVAGMSAPAFYYDPPVPSTIYDAAGMGVLGVSVLFPLWLLVYWFAFTTRYLRLPRGWLVALLLWMMTVLATPVVGGLLGALVAWLFGLE